MFSDSPSSWSKIMGSVNAKPDSALPAEIITREEPEIVGILLQAVRTQLLQIVSPPVDLWLHILAKLVLMVSLIDTGDRSLTKEATEPTTLQLTSQNPAHSSKQSSGHLVGTKELQRAMLLGHDD